MGFMKRVFLHKSKNVWGIKERQEGVMQRNISTLINTNAPREVICRNAKAWSSFCKNEKGDSAAYPETGGTKIFALCRQPNMPSRIRLAGEDATTRTCIHPLGNIGKHVYAAAAEKIAELRLIELL